MKVKNTWFAMVLIVPTVLGRVVECELPVYAPLNRSSIFKDICMSVARNSFDINAKLIDWDTWKIFVCFFPAVGAARMADNRLQKCFIDRRKHKNIHQMDRSFHEFSQWGIIFSTFGFCVSSLSARDPEVKLSSRMYLTGLPFVYLFAKVAKKFDAGCFGLRPWCEGFSACHRSSGGFPSGHLAIYSYAAILFGRRFGVQYAVPLGGLALVTALSFLNCNRHYASQMMAGTAIGALYAYSVDKVIDKHWLSRDISIEPTVSCQGNPAIELAYRF